MRLSCLWPVRRHGLFCLFLKGLRAFERFGKILLVEFLYPKLPYRFICRLADDLENGPRPILMIIHCGAPDTFQRGFRDCFQRWFISGGLKLREVHRHNLLLELATIECAIRLNLDPSPRHQVRIPCPLILAHREHRVRPGDCSIRLLRHAESTQIWYSENNEAIFGKLNDGALAPHVDRLVNQTCGISGCETCPGDYRRDKNGQYCMSYGFHFLQNDERMHPYQRGRASITGLRVVSTGNHRNRAAGRGCHDAACSVLGCIRPERRPNINPIIAVKTQVDIVQRIEGSNRFLIPPGESRQLLISSVSLPCVTPLLVAPPPWLPMKPAAASTPRAAPTISKRPARLSTRRPRLWLHIAIRGLFAPPLESFMDYASPERSLRKPKLNRLLKLIRLLVKIRIPIIISIAPLT